MVRQRVLTIPADSVAELYEGAAFYSDTMHVDTAQKAIDRGSFIDRCKRPESRQQLISFRTSSSEWVSKFGRRPKEPANERRTISSETSSRSTRGHSITPYPNYLLPTSTSIIKTSSSLIEGRTIRSLGWAF